MTERSFDVVQADLAPRDGGAELVLFRDRMGEPAEVLRAWLPDEVLSALRQQVLELPED